MKAVLVSAVIHAAMIGALFAGWSQLISSFTVAGGVRVVQVSALITPAEEEESESVEIELTMAEMLPPAAVPMPKDDLLLLESSALEARLVDVSKNGELPSAGQVRFQAAKVENKIDMERVSEPKRRRPPAELVAAVMNSTEIAKPIPRQKLHTVVSQPAVVEEQFAGPENETPADFSNNRPPEYPAEAIRLRLEGTVVVRLHIGSAGSVEQVDVVKSSGHAVLDQAAVKALQSWRGRPRMRGDNAIPSTEQFPIHFQW